MLYRLSINPDLQDQKTQELKLYQYLKQVLKEVQDSIGGVNNFDIHVDPIDSVARIIDLNYIDATDRATAYDNAFQIEIANTSGSVRSYSLQSQIFPEQGAMIAISAQVGGGGAQGYQNNTMLDFNNNLEDRIIPKKIAPTSLPVATSPSISEQLTVLKTNLNTIQSSFFPEVDNKVNNNISPNSNIDQSKTSEYKNTLKNIITYFQGITNSNTKNRAIIPIKMSLTMDGIGGLVIGHLFKIPSDLLPKGYKYENSKIGARLLQIVTTLDHKIENGDWTTTIGAQQVITNEPAGGSTSFTDITKTDTKTGETTITLKNVYPELKEVPYAKTTVTKAEVIAYLKSRNDFDVNVKRSVLAIFINESGSGSKGVNNNYFGIQADNNKWPDSTAYVIGTSVKVDNGRATRRFAVFADYKSNLLFMLNTIRRRNLIANTAEEWAKKYVYEWVSPPNKEFTYNVQKYNLVSIYNSCIKDIK